jgi:hypothetical protein
MTGFLLYFVYSIQSIFFCKLKVKLKVMNDEKAFQQALISIPVSPRADSPGQRHPDPPLRLAPTGQPEQIV